MRVLSSLLVTVAVVALLVASVPLVRALHTFPGYRLAQYTVGGEQRGSGKTAFLLQGAVLGQKSVSGTLALAPLESVLDHKDSETTIVDRAVAEGASALLILLPEDDSQVDHAQWAAEEVRLNYVSTKIPVYFARRSPELDALIAEISSDGGISSSALSFLSGEALRFELSSKEAVVIKDGELITLEGALYGAKAEGGTDESLPTIVISTHLDAWSAAPQLAHGAGSGSSVAALLEVARLFSTLFAGARTVPRANVLFVVENAGTHSFAGTKQWLEKADARRIDALTLALALDDFNHDGTLHLHVSRSDKEPNAKKLYDTFEATAKRLGVPFEIVHKKINMSDPHVPWQHEQFARQKVLAATLSSVPAARPHFGAANLFDRRVNAAALARNVRVLAETLAAHLYATNGTDVFNGDLAVSPVYLEATAQGLVRFPRATPYMAHNRDAAALVDGVEKELSRFVKDVKRSVSPFPQEEYQFYNRTEGVIAVYRAKTVVFDLLESVAVAVYLFALYAYAVGFKAATNAVRNFFFKRAPVKRR